MSRSTFAFLCVVGCGVILGFVFQEPVLAAIACTVYIWSQTLIQVCEIHDKLEKHIAQQKMRE